jgi:protein-tyrosine phosphatase
MVHRHHPLEGCLNLRDLGGYPTKDGRQVRWGCVFRAGELCLLTDADADAITRLGIRVVVDLRNRWERSARPDRLPPGIDLVERRSPPSGSSPTPTLEELIVSGDLPVRDDELRARVYVDMLDRLAPEVGAVLGRAVDAVDRPLLFHCVAGKDRTGVVAAVLLGVLGVAEEDIVEDYELTTDHYGARRLDELADLMREHAVRSEALRHLVDARTPALTACLRHLHDRWGGFDRYVTERVGAPADLPSRLRTALTVASSDLACTS